MRIRVLAAIGLGSYVSLLSTPARGDESAGGVRPGDVGVAQDGMTSAFALELDAELEPLFWVGAAWKPGSLKPCTTRAMGPSLRNLPPGQVLRFRHANGQLSAFVLDCSSMRAAARAKPPVPAPDVPPEVRR